MSPFSINFNNPLWNGRYRRPWIEESVYHVNNDGLIHVRWNQTGLQYKCPVIMDETTTTLAEAVNRVKEQYNGQRGGTFFINEFGQIICPTFSLNKYLVGEIDTNDIIFFHDVRNNNEAISLNDDENLTLGDVWDRPYMGARYNINEYYNEIYYWDVGIEGGEAIRPPRQDEDIIESIRLLRPEGPVSFIVNQYGIVVTRVEQNGIWQPRYVGRIDYDQWFSKELPD